MTKQQTWTKISKQLKANFISQNKDLSKKEIDFVWPLHSKQLKEQFDKQYKAKQLAKKSK
jgi:hypothetical protein